VSNLPARRTSPGPRTMLDRQEGLIEFVAELYASGMSQRDMIEELPISDRATLSKWIKDERVSLKVEEILREKSLRIRRKVDAELEARVSDKKRLQHMPPETLLKIRSELSKDFPERDGTDAEHVRIVEALYLKAAHNPAAAELIRELNLDPEGTITATGEEVTEAEVVEPDPDALPPIDVDASLAAAFAEDDIEPEGAGAVEF
jgi:hypothetical protein